MAGPGSQQCDGAGARNDPQSYRPARSARDHVAKEGENEILVQFPGIQDPERAKELIGKTAVLEFKMVDDSITGGGCPQGRAAARRRDPLWPAASGAAVSLTWSKVTVLMTGDVVTDARVRPGGRLEGHLRRSRARRARRRHLRRASRRERRAASSASCSTTRSIPLRSSRSGYPADKCRLRGSFSSRRPMNWQSCCVRARCPRRSKSLRSAPSARRSDATRFVRASCRSSSARWRCWSSWRSTTTAPGLLADFGLTLNILLLVCVMAAMQATLTLPGIAGIVLTLGMSVDANVLVNERMREELRDGQNAARSGQGRLRAGVVRDSRFQHLDLRRRADSVPVWHRSGERLRGNPMRRSADRGIFVLRGDASLV